VNTKIKIVIIGAGVIAEEHIKSFIIQQDAEIIGIFSRSETKALQIANKYNISNVVNSIEALAELIPDVVVIAVSISSTENVCKEAFKYPWLILVEKPVGIDYNNAKALYDLAILKKAKVYVAMNRRQYSSTINALQLLKGELEPRFIIVHGQEDPLLQLKSGMETDVVKNLMYTNSLHIIDYFNIFGRGEITQINISESWNSGNSDKVIANIEYTSGDFGLYVGIWNMPGPWSVTITTKNLNISLKPLEHITVQNYGSRKSNTLELSSVDLNYKPGFYVQAYNTIKAAKGLEHNLVTIGEVLKSMSLIKNIYEL
jgi:predicted dehydrogenase